MGSIVYGTDDHVVPNYSASSALPTATNLKLVSPTAPRTQATPPRASVTPPRTSAPPARKKRRVSFAPNVQTHGSPLARHSQSTEQAGDPSNRGHSTRSVEGSRVSRADVHTSAIPHTSTQSTPTAATQASLPRTGRRVTRTISSSARERVPFFRESTVPVPDILDWVLAENRRQLYERLASSPARVPDTSGYGQASSSPIVIDAFFS